MTADRGEFVSTLKGQLALNRPEEAIRMLADLHPADVADLFESLDETDKKILFQQWDTNTASDVIAELSEFSRDQILANLSPRRLGEIVAEYPRPTAKRGSNFR